MAAAVTSFKRGAEQASAGDTISAVKWVIWYLKCRFLSVFCSIFSLQTDGGRPAAWRRDRSKEMAR